MVSDGSKMAIVPLIILKETHYGYHTSMRELIVSCLPLFGNAGSHSIAFMNDQIGSLMRVLYCLILDLNTFYTSQFLLHFV